MDKVQGEEFEFVILDFVVNDASSRSGMGFTRDENRCTVAFTRAKSALVTLLPTSLLENAVTANRDDGSTRFYKAKDLFVVEYLKYMCKQASVYTMTPKGKFISFPSFSFSSLAAWQNSVEANPRFRFGSKVPRREPRRNIRRA